MLAQHARTVTASLLWFPIWLPRTAAFVNIPFSSTYYGVDGPWQAVTAQVGGWINNTIESAQWVSVDLLPGGYYASFVPNPQLCTSSPLPDCGTGGTWDPTGNQTNVGPIYFEPSYDLRSSSGLYMEGYVFAQNLNVNGGDQYTVPNASVATIVTGNQTLPGGSVIGLELGSFSLGAQSSQQVFSTLSTNKSDASINTNIMPGYFYNTSVTNSDSFTLQIGSTAFDYPGSMYFGGYDKGRAIGPGTSWGGFSGDGLPLQDIVIGVETGGSPFSFEKKSGLLISNASTAEPIQAVPEPLVPYLHLPHQTCQAIAKELPVHFDSACGYYLWDTSDPSYHKITTSPAYLGFVFPPGQGAIDDVTIRVPFQLLVLNLTTEASGQPGAVPYFPCMAYEPSSGSPYYLGRTFLQAALFGCNWNNGVWWLAQAPGPGPSKAGLGLQPADIENSATTLDYYPDDGRFAESWSQHWTVLSANSGSDNVVNLSNGGSSLSTGAEAGIGIGAAVGAIAIIALIAWLLIRRRKKNNASSAPADKTVYAHYGDASQANPPMQQTQWMGSPPQQQHHDGVSPYEGSPQRDYAFQEAYAPQKGGGVAHGGIPELSGTMRSPAHELEAPYRDGGA